MSGNSGFRIGLLETEDGKCPLCQKDLSMAGGDKSARARGHIAVAHSVTVDSPEMDEHLRGMVRLCRSGDRYERGARRQ